MDCANSRARARRAQLTPEQRTVKLEKSRAYHRQWSEKNRERLRALDAESRARLREARKPEAAKWAHKQVLRTHGITQEQFDAMLVAQSGLCAICTEQMWRPNIDHCHDTHEVRGLLCTRCNSGLAKFADSIEGLERAIDYLKNAPRVQPVRKRADKGERHRRLRPSPFRVNNESPIATYPEVARRVRHKDVA